MAPRRIQRIPISSREQWLELRKQDITASVVGALFGCHPYETPAGLWAIKTGVNIPDEDNAAMRRGRLLENAVGQAFMEQSPHWVVKKANIYLRDRALRLGATPDFFATDPESRRVVLQAKTVNPWEFKRSWTDRDAPFWITLQCLTEAMLDNSDLGMIAALIVDGWRFDLKLYEVPRHAASEKRIKDAVAQFWQDVADGREPRIDYERDGALLAVLFPREEPGKAIDLRGDNRMPELLETRERLKAEIAAGEKQQDTIETEIKAKLGDAEAALIDGWRVTLKEQHRKEFMVRATSFRTLRVAREEKAA